MQWKLTGELVIIQNLCGCSSTKTPVYILHFAGSFEKKPNILRILKQKCNDYTS